jgi:putative ATP-dependent endonuclease of OLD family
MEEPEIALPPHAQRRLVDFVIKRMGQAIISSHSPYVIERFEPETIVMLTRTDQGELTSKPLELGDGFKPKKYREERRQFAEAILGRGVIVVEGGTEALVLPVVADILDADKTVEYTHLDLAGASIYDAKSDVSVPPLASLFKNLGKRCYGLHDTPNQAFSKELQEKAKQFDVYLMIPYDSMEELLLAEMASGTKRAFLATVTLRVDYPKHVGYLSDAATDEEVEHLTAKVLWSRKGPNNGYAALLVAEAHDASQLPPTLVTFLMAVDQDLGQPSLPGGLTVEDAAVGADSEQQPGDAASAPVSDPLKGEAPSTGV